MKYFYKLTVNVIILITVWSLFLGISAFGQQDWFLTSGQSFFAPFGGQCSTIGLNYISIPPVVNPDQNVQLIIHWFTKDVSGSPVAYMNVFGNWIPNNELGRCSVYGNIIDDLMSVVDTIYFSAPSSEGTYRLRWCFTLAYAPVAEFWGHLPAGQSDPGVGPFSEVSFIVSDHMSPVAIDDGDGFVQKPDTRMLSQNYPNPFNPATTIEYEVGQRGHVSILIFNSIGQQVRKLVDEIQPAGAHSVPWDGLDDGKSRVATGVYLYKIEADGFVETKKMVLLK